MCAASHSDRPTPGLYVVATPIGNLGDLAPRARALLETADIIAAEDTRTARKLLPSRSNGPRLLSLTEHNVEHRIPELLRTADEGAVALVSEAGTPGVADPGARLVSAAHREGIRVIAVPGPSALAAAMSVSGFDAPGTLFIGFLPRKRGERIAALRKAASCASNIVFFESPGRLAGALAATADALGDPETVVCREISKLHEEVVYGAASELADRFAGTKGECTVVIRVPPAKPEAESQEEARSLLEAMKRAGARRSAAAAEVSRRTGQPRDELYRAWDTL